MTAPELAIVAIAAFLAGGVNAVAGGGTLITFPTLTALGLPPITANVTNAVALTPGYLGGALAQRRELRGRGRREGALAAIGAVGGAGGGVLLLATGEERFASAVPFLILVATGLLAAQEWLRSVIARRERAAAHGHRIGEPIGVLLGSVYGGYFGAGLGIVLLGVLGLTSDEPLPRLNASKQLIAFAANAAAALTFVLVADVDWPVAFVMMAGSVAGGHLGGSVVGRIPAVWLRRVVVALGLTVSIAYLVT